MADNTGLLLGLSEGLKSGMGTYNQVRDREDRKELERQKALRDQQDSEDRLALLKEQRANQALQTEIEMKSKGLIKDEQGGLIEDPNSTFRQDKEQESLLKKAQYRKTMAEANKAEKEAKGLLGGGDVPFKSLPKDKQVAIEKLAGSKASTEAIKNQMDVLITQMQDPNLDQGQKLQAAQNAAKLINSPLGADAVGAEEAKRVLSYLDPNPQPFGPKGMKIGPDIEGFTKAMTLNSQRLGTANEMLQNQIDTAYGRKPQAGLISAAAPKAGTGKALSPEDREALDWANKWPNDQRSWEIKKRLGQ